MSAILLASLLLVIQEAPLRRPPPSAADLPSWSRTPSADEMQAAYPAEAAKTNLAASATLECTVAADGGLSDCVAAAEAAPGFGAAALSVAPKFRLPTKSPAGVSTVGRTVQVPIQWVNPSTATVSLIAPADAGPRAAVAFNCRVRAGRSLDNCVVVDAKPRGGEALSRAGEALLRVTAPSGSAEFSRILVLVAVR
jgi:hypothetical protein